jgi:hypothetical protein
MFWVTWSYGKLLLLWRYRRSHNHSWNAWNVKYQHNNCTYNAPYKHYHSTLSAGISQCGRYLKKLLNFTHLPILTKIKVAIPFTVLIFFSLSHVNQLNLTYKPVHEWKQIYNFKKFYNFNPETSRKKVKPDIGVQLVYMYISNWLILAEREVLSLCYTWIIIIIIIIRNILYNIYNSILFNLSPYKLTYIYMYNKIGHRNTRHSKSNVQHVGREPQLALGQYIILTATAPNLIHHKMEYL